MKYKSTKYIFKNILMRNSEYERSNQKLLMTTTFYENYGGLQQI